MEKQSIPLELVRRIYEYRILQYYGIGLSVFSCISCGKEEDFQTLYIDKGGVVCKDCRDKKMREAKESGRFEPMGSVHPVKLTPALLYALQYVSAAPLTRLYAFLLSDEIFAEFAFIVKHFMRLHVDHRFRSEQMLEMI
jgi:DNA repair protein RecO (recombination protein O)